MQRDKVTFTWSLLVIAFNNILTTTKKAGREFVDAEIVLVLTLVKM